jgi:hypothetical protein
MEKKQKLLWGLTGIKTEDKTLQMVKDVAIQQTLYTCFII